MYLFSQLFLLLLFQVIPFDSDSFNPIRKLMIANWSLVLIQTQLEWMQFIQMKMGIQSNFELRIKKQKTKY